MNQKIHVTTITWLSVSSLIMILPTHHHHTTMICCNKYNFCSSISRHKDEVLKEDDTKTNDWQLEMNDKYLLDLRSNSSEELQRNEFKNMRPEIDSREYTSSECASLNLSKILRPEIDRREYTSSECASLNLSKENSFKSRKLYRKDYSSEKLLRNSPTLPYQNMTINAYFRMINGNRGSSHNIRMWN